MERTQAHDPRFTDLARFYVHEFADIRAHLPGDYGSDLVRAFRKHRDAGKLEIITCGATHGFLPLMETVPQAVRAQVQVAVQHYRRVLGARPAGIWLPGVRLLSRGSRQLPARRRASASASSSRTASPTPTRGPRFGVHAPIATPGGVVFFARDMESSRQVWSAESGYPGDDDYREFYKDVGWELPLDYLGDFLPDGAAQEPRASSTTA